MACAGDVETLLRPPARAGGLTDMYNGSMDAHLWERGSKYLQQERPAREDGVALPAGETLGQKNAPAKAKSYLNISAFSYEGLIKQLKFENFHMKMLFMELGNCGADGNEQVATKAQSYLAIASFSIDGLIRQPEFDGFPQPLAIPKLFYHKNEKSRHSGA